MSSNTKKTKTIVAVAMFSALAFITTALCGYIPKVAGFLSLEIKDAVIVICSLVFGPLAGLSIAVIVPILECFTISSTGWYGLIMNILSSATFVVITGLIYKYKRTFYGAIVGLLAGVFSVTAVMLLANLLITPLYLRWIGVPATTKYVMDMIPTILLPFNLFKAMLNGALVLLLYKPISRALKKTGFLDGSNDANTIKHHRSRTVIVTVISAMIIVASLFVIFFVLK